MLTRCPACETHFRITPAQLKARSGSVRCGECQHVFNALDSLIEEPMMVVAPPASESSPQAVPEYLSGTEMEAAEYSEAPADEVAVTCPRSGIPGTQSESAPTPEPVEDALDALSALDSAAQEPTEAAEAEAAEPTTEPEAETPGWSETFPEPPPAPRRWPWVIGSVLAIITMGLQAALFFRVELAVLWPEARPALVALCNMADCEVGLPAKVGLVGIEASDLHPDSEHPGRLALTATLKSRAPFAQQFPNLELTLTDTADQTIARKVLAPADYLPPTTPIANGMQPNADVMVAVGVDSGEMTASGYRLYLFYP